MQVNNSFKELWMSELKHIIDLNIRHKAKVFF